MSDQSEISIPEISSLVHDRKAFNDFIYTPLSEAIVELGKRREDKALESLTEKLLDHDVPAPFLSGPRCVLARYVASPTYETLRFLHITFGIEELQPLVWEYLDDKFVPSNISKRMLGKLAFYKKRDRNGALQTDRLEVIDMENAMNKRISDLQTVWGESLTDFHHAMFTDAYKHLKQEDILDISSWYRKHGPGAKEYYPPLLTLFVRHGILFENFVLLDKEESPFITNVFLPAFVDVYQRTGKKPLIVAFEPTDIEGDKFWLCYTPDTKAFVEARVADRMRV